mmetsp:Transcript_11161/g.21585  ORF Transcript_11161/g.21585 Transcript_11161/m.21585 type:complete len:92 (-) Transcript_11161:2004-2279(-)
MQKHKTRQEKGMHFVDNGTHSNKKAQRKHLRLNKVKAPLFFIYSVQKGTARSNECTGPLNDTLSSPPFPFPHVHMNLNLPLYHVFPSPPFL